MCWLRSLSPVVVLAVVFTSQRSLGKAPAIDDPAKVDADYGLQGEYVGEISTPEGKREKRGAQVIALGNGKFHAVGYPGGLPGAGWDKSKKIDADGELKDGHVVFKVGDMVGTIKGREVVVTSNDGQELGRLKKEERKSPTLGAKPPAGAVVLFDGTSTEAFSGGKLTADGLLAAGVTSKQLFGSCTVHLEFRTPYQPTDRGQGRGNSGCYLQGRYEVQILDSFGLKGENNECGGIYSIKSPDVNMCLPPLVWQTYDIDYTAAEYDAQGKKLKNARISVRHNGVEIHKDVELPKGTTAAPVPEGPRPGPIYLQDHGNPVRFRNVWVVEKKAS